MQPVAPQEALPPTLVLRALDPQEAQLKRIEEISRNARANWFVLLGTLVFAGVTLLGVRDIDFFGVDRSTQLPLLNVSVPVTYFFGAGTALIAAVYTYLHLYLSLLWPELADAPARIDGKPLARRIFPWLISEWALQWRDGLRIRHARRNGLPPPIPCCPERSLGWLGTLMAIALVWCFGPLVLGGMWWRSAVAHMDDMTLLLGFLFAFACWIGWRNWRSARALLGGTGGPSEERDRRISFRRVLRGSAFFLALLLPISALSLIRTASEYWPGEYVYWKDHGEREETVSLRNSLNAGRIEDESLELYWGRRRELAGSILDIAELWADKLYSTVFYPLIARADLTEQFVATRPPDWLDREEAEREFRAHWADREGLDYAAPFPSREGRDVEAEFQRVWKNRRANQLSSLVKPVLNDRDFAGASLERAFLPGILMRRARLQGADLRQADLEGADLSEASFEDGNLGGASFDRANLSYANLEGAVLFGANLEGAYLTNARLEGANLSGARLEGANLSGARLEGANLLGARLEGANLLGARLDGARLVIARLEGANLFGARLEGAILFGARLEGADLSEAAFRKVDLSETELQGALNFQNSFGDATVELPEGMTRPCQWANDVLSDAEFFGRWRGWARTEALWPQPEKFENHPAIPPPEGCRWSLP